MNKNISQSIVDRISRFKVQLILNKNLYIDEVNNLLEKIHSLTSELEMYT